MRVHCRAHSEATQLRKLRQEAARRRMRYQQSRRQESIDPSRSSTQALEYTTRNPLQPTKMIPHPLEAETP